MRPYVLLICCSGSEVWFYLWLKPLVPGDSEEVLYAASSLATYHHHIYYEMMMIGAVVSASVVSRVPVQFVSSCAAPACCNSTAEREEQ